MSLHGISQLISIRLRRRSSFLTLAALLMVAANDLPSSMAQDDRPQADEKELLARFHAEYPEAIKRLESAIHDIEGTWQFRERSKRNPDGHRFDVKFYRSGDMLRFDRVLSDEKPPRIGDRTAGNVATLSTPSVSAKVHDPSTNHAFVEQGGSQIKKVNADISIRFSRFLKAAYCIDDVVVWDKIKAKTYNIRRASTHPTHRDWITLTCDYREPAGALVSEGTIDITFSPEEDWAIRELNIESGPPFSFIMKSSVAELYPIRSSFMPKSYICNIFDVSKAHHKDSEEGGTWEDGYEFRLMDAKAGPVSSKVFTLGSMGIGQSPPTWARPIWWWFIVSIGALGIWVYVKGRPQKAVGAGQ